MRSIYENWNEHIVKLTWIPNMKIDNEKITSVLRRLNRPESLHLAEVYIFIFTLIMLMQMKY